jgi:Glycosyl hydrolase catalytic core
VCKRLGVLAAVVLVAAGLAVPAATASRSLLVGILDESQTLYGNPDYSFPILRQLRTEVLRVNLYWGGRFGVASERPFNATNPRDPAYDWSIYDRTVHYANQYGIKMVFSIYGTPGWANGFTGLNRAPRKFADLQNFAYAAARRYSGVYSGADGRRLPAVKLWLAWTEPNNPINLFPQYVRSGGGWVAKAPQDYARICNAVFAGIHATSLKGEKVACGVTAPRGNNSPGGLRSSISPLVFLRLAKAAGMRKFDAYAHHPYYGSKNESPTTKSADGNAITLANINTLIAEITRLYGPKRLWITEYGYQTNPPDKTLGVSYARQASWMTEAYAIARRNPRIDMMLWFLMKDDTSRQGWQSGFLTASGKRKPSFYAFRRIPR